ncbi:metabotropic glutamate receptor 5-like [Saccostrea echinata]|uniref:metabotropic glutamate receptor 5-like n=1 Tax=Saccostrea echinata TaxID=191078 RepID=UPI002A81874D|nr:metabotropic glutamate receptor 5-like [Saccostrea echinata]
MEVFRCSLFFLLATVFAEKRRIARSEPEGDLVIGALFPVHKGPKDLTGYTRTCGEVWEQYGIHRVEIFLRTLEEINNDQTLLPNITLGYDIRDSCWYSPICLEQSIDFIKDSIASLDKSQSKNTTGRCKTENRKPIVGLIGPGTSQNSIQVQNLLQIFKLPQIGYSATSMELSDKNLYKYFMRVVPSDMFQAQALLDIVLQFNWTYISTVHTDGNYGQRGIESFTKLAEEAGVCIAKTAKIARGATDDEHVEIIKNLMKKERAKVIVCFCDGETVRSLYNATAMVPGAKNHFLVLGSDGWNDRPDVVRGNEENVAGGMSIKLTSPKIKDFDPYFNSLNPYTNTRNPWFKEFWAKTYDCTFDDKVVKEKGFKKCTGKETRRNGEYVQDSKLGFVINAIYTMAHALHNMREDICGSNAGLCPEMLPVKGELYLNYLLNVSLTTYSNYELHYDENGDPPARYDIMNFQKIKDETGNVTYKYLRVGRWETGQLSMNESIIYWPSSGFGNPEASVCSDPCAKGSIKKLDEQTKCCWTCIPCKENEIMMDSNTCKACAVGWWPNEDLTACKEIEIEYLKWHDTEAVVAVAFACLGIFGTLWIGVIFICHNDTPVVKATTRELMYIIMFGIIMAFSSNFFLVAKPTIVTCYFSRILPGLSFSLIYGSLVTKTNRIARILQETKKIITKKPRFMSASAQVIITCILVGIECAIITVMLIIEPADSMLDYPTIKRVRLICNTTTMGIAVPFGFDLMLIFMCTLYAIKTRNLPENFNEAKFIGFIMYTTCVIWLGFFAIYFYLESGTMVFAVSIAISGSATVALVLLFIPKIYVIVCAPEKNTRSAFATSKEVRCHIGSVSYHSESGNDFGKERPFEKGSGLLHRKKFSFGKLKLNHKQTANNRKETASLPPNIKLNRENSMHIRIPNHQKFPWSKKDHSNSNSGDEDDRLSTISSKEESRSGSEKRKKKTKQDSECQTDAEWLEHFVAKSSVRRRKPDKNCHESDGSINSDEIFLSLPVSDSTENRGMYRLSPRHSDRSPLLGGYDSALEEENKEEHNFPLNNLSNIHVEDNAIPSVIPFKSQPLHSLNEREPFNVNRIDNSRVKFTTRNSRDPLYSHINISDDVPRKVNENGHLIQIEDVPLLNKNSVSQRRSPPTLKIDDSDLYRRRQQNHPVVVEEKSLDKGRYPLPLMLNQMTKNSVYPLKEDSHCNCANHDVIPEQHLRQRPSVVSNTLSSGSSVSVEDMTGFDIHKLEEEEVSMLSFRDYMKNRGIDLDMSDVQSSEV